MNTNFSTSDSFKKVTFWVIATAFFAGFVLSILSWLEICVEHCSANQQYLLFKMPFSIIGMFFFSVLTTLHFLSRKYSFLGTIIGWIIAASLGAEIVFIGIQHYQIGHWCPLCLSIAFSLLVAGTCKVSLFIKDYLKIREKGESMKNVRSLFVPLPFFILGFIMAFVGVSKVNQAEASVKEMQQKLAFGSRNSPVAVYFVTDWFCASCHRIEPIIERIVPKIHSNVTYYFIDYPIHSKTLNYSPYNLAFLVNNKPQYFEARNALTRLTQSNESPTDDDIAAAARKAHVQFKELSYLDVKSGLDFFDDIVKRYDLNSTPTVIITNLRTHQTQKLEGTEQISDEKILKAIQTVSK